MKVVAKVFFMFFSNLVTLKSSTTGYFPYSDFSHVLAKNRPLSSGIAFSLLLGILDSCYFSDLVKMSSIGFMLYVDDALP